MTTPSSLYEERLNIRKSYSFFKSKRRGGRLLKVMNGIEDILFNLLFASNPEEAWARW
ncbi:MAG: hypothetical protein H7A36_04265 [Chlamydiales bacterium]|nr:hypothetical protein [Chlamydiales bacterium]